MNPAGREQMKKLLMILPLVGMLCFTFSCQKQATEEVPEGITEEEAKVLLDSLMEIMSEGNLDLAEEILDPECVLRYPILPEPLVGIEALKAMAKNNAISFPDFKGTIEELVVKGDKIWCRYTMTGTHTGPLGDLPPTGKTFRITGLAVTRVADGKIVEDETFWNVLDFYQQLGFTLTPPQLLEPEEKK
jgi:steroid delta-isomerase-like uncharacterized protein